MCGDGSDDPGILPALVDLVEAGNVVACASRYLPGGARTGGPRVKAFLSRLAGRLFPGVTDPTSAYKAYSADFLTAAWPQASAGFEMGIEMCAKADRMGLPVAEVPVVWAERTSGSSHFRWRWVPAYARWLLYAHTGR